MKGTDRTILLILPIVAVLVGVWILVISPKRADEGELKDQVATLRATADQADQQVAQAELARKNFDVNYSTLVDLGAAAPADDDQSTLVYNLAEIANKNDLRFSGFTLAETPTGIDSSATAVATATPPATESSTTATTATESTTSTTATTSEPTTESTSTTATSTVAPATEATAATLPLGAAVGPAGMPISSYAFSLDGKYFGTADFLADVDSLVEASATKPPVVHGRLLTIDGFALALGQLEDFPTITADLAVTTYEVPASQGLEAGATPAGPAPVGTTTDSTTTSTATAPTATVTP